MARTYPWKVSDELWERVEPLIRWEKLSAPYEAFLKLVCALICFHQCDRLSVFG